jgi:hypothetical protein
VALRKLASSRFSKNKILSHIKKKKVIKKTSFYRLGNFSEPTFENRTSQQPAVVKLIIATDSDM